MCSALRLGSTASVRHAFNVLQLVLANLTLHFVCLFIYKIHHMPVNFFQYAQRQ